MAVQLSESGVCSRDEFRLYLLPKSDGATRCMLTGGSMTTTATTCIFCAREHVLREKGIVDSSMVETKIRAISEADEDDHDH
jgi:hypothetical protein